MVGSTRVESGVYEAIINKAISFMKNGGTMFYQSLDRTECMNDFLKICIDNDLRVDNYILDTQYEFNAQYWKISK